MTELRENQLIERESHGRRGSGHREYSRSVAYARNSARKHRAGTDLLVTEHSKQLAKAIEAFVQHSRYGLECGIAGGETGSPRQQDRLATAVTTPSVASLAKTVKF